MAAYAGGAATVIRSAPETLETTTEVFHVPQTGADILIPAVSLTNSYYSPYLITFSYVIGPDLTTAAGELTGLTIPANTFIHSVVHKTDVHGSTGLASRTLSYKILTGGTPFTAAETIAASNTLQAMTMVAVHQFTAGGGAVWVTLGGTAGNAGCVVTTSFLCSTIR